MLVLEPLVFLHIGRGLPLSKCGVILKMTGISLSSDFWTGWKGGVASPYPIFCNLHDIGTKSGHTIAPVGHTTATA